MTEESESGRSVLRDQLGCRSGSKSADYLLNVDADIDTVYQALAFGAIIVFSSSVSVERAMRQRWLHAGFYEQEGPLRCDCFEVF